MPLTLLGRYKRGHVRLPLFSCLVSAGFPSPADDHIEAELDVLDLFVRHPAATFYLRVGGDSMTGAGIYRGDTLVVDRSLTPRPGQVVVAIVRGDFTCKRLELENGLPVLRSANPAYPDIRLAAEDELEVFGVVTHNIHALASA